VRWRHRVTTAEAGERLDRLLALRLAEALPDLTRSRIKRLVEAGRVTVDGTPVKAGHPVRAGERVEVEVPPPPAAVPEPEEIPLDVVFEDDAVVVVDKPAGMVVHPGAGRSRGTLVNALLGRGTSLSAVGAPFRPGIVHRLDKGTSGLLVVAKTDAAHRRLAAALAAREVKRRYWAMVWGAPTPETGRITGSLARSRADRRRMRVVGSGGREAVTRYRVRWSGNGVSVLVLALETGRTHQIRAHLKHRGYPVFGDPEYGGRSARGFAPPAPERSRIRAALGALDRQALHAALLAFRHPVTGAPMEFTSPLAEDIGRAAALLGVPPEATTVGSKEEV
jgi:23S rRNA pseudouridine1911/1915/1917 synthase